MTRAMKYDDHGPDSAGDWSVKYESLTLVSPTRIFRDGELGGRMTGSGQDRRSPLRDGAVELCRTRPCGRYPTASRRAGVRRARLSAASSRGSQWNACRAASCSSQSANVSACRR